MSLQVIVSIVVSLMSDDDYKKVGFDARIQYYGVLKNEMVRAAYASFVGDNHSRYRSLRTMFTMVRPYIRKVDYEALHKLFDSVNQYLSSQVDRRFSNSVNSKIYTLLTEIDDELHMSARDMFLPTADREADDVDWDKWMRESDL